MLLSITYYTRLGVVEARVDEVIQFLNSYYLGLGRESHLNNDYNFLKECLTASKIL